MQSISGRCAILAAFDNNLADHLWFLPRINPNRNGQPFLASVQGNFTNSLFSTSEYMLLRAARRKYKPLEGSETIVYNLADSAGVLPLISNRLPHGNAF